MVLDARALRIGRVPASREKEGHGAAAAAAGTQVGTRPARLLRPLHVLPERSVGRRSLPAAFQVEDVVFAAGIEGAGRRRPPLVDAQQRQRSDAARDLELLQALAVGSVARDEGRGGAVELDRNAVAGGELEREREQAFALLPREPFLEVTDARPSRRLQAEQLDLDELPNIRSMMPLLLSGDGDERFGFGLQLMIDGLLNTEPPKI